MTNNPFYTSFGFPLHLDDADSLGLTRPDPDYERLEVACCRTLIKPGNRVLDIGAHIGLYSILFSSLVGTNGLVIAFEPEPKNRDLLERNILLNNCTNTVVYPFALTDKENSSEKLYCCPFNSGMHRLYPSVCSDGTAITVPCRSGDEIVTGPIDFIKIDVEGLEERAIKGLDKCIRSSPNISILMEYFPLALIESGTKPSELISLLSGFGLSPFSLSQPGIKRTTPEILCASAEVFEEDDFLAFARECHNKTQGKPDSLSLWHVANEYLTKIGYTRPYYENLLWASPNKTEEILRIRF